MTAQPATAEATQSPQLEQAIQRVRGAAATFARLSIDERLSLLSQMRRGYHEVAKDSVEAACRAKGLDPSSPLSGEEWLAGPMPVLRVLRQLEASLARLKANGTPGLDASRCRTLADGRLAVKVFPADPFDAVLLPRHTCEVHMQPGVTAANLREHQASFYKRPHQGRLCAVLGAGNVNSIPSMDCIYKLFVEGTACVLKMNPVNEYVGPFIERAFRCLVERGFLAVVYGGAQEGATLVNHPAVDEVHITGSDKTHDLMVWGPPGPERAARQARNEPLLRKTITSELGNVSPILVVPGPYSEADLAYQAASVAGMVANNGSFNCVAAKLLITPTQWAQRDRFLALLQQGLDRATPRKAYYPGAEERWRQFTHQRPGLKLVGAAKSGELPYAIIPDVDFTRADDRIFTTEPWCAILSETRVGGPDAASFLAKATRFANQTVWGTLTATLIVHPRTLADPTTGAAVERAIEELQYGSVVLNTWSGTCYGTGSAPWGGHPSSTLRNIQSGLGWVHNTFMLEDIEKVVMRAPLRMKPLPPWYPGHRTLDTLGRRLTDMEAEPSWLKLPGLVSAALGA